MMPAGESGRFMPGRRRPVTVPRRIRYLSYATCHLNLPPSLRSYGATALPRSTSSRPSAETERFCSLASCSRGPPGPPRELRPERGELGPPRVARFGRAPWSFLFSCIPRIPQVSGPAPIRVRAVCAILVRRFPGSRPKRSLSTVSAGILVGRHAECGSASPIVPRLA